MVGKNEFLGKYIGPRASQESLMRLVTDEVIPGLQSILPHELISMISELAPLYKEFLIANTACNVKKAVVPKATKLLLLIRESVLNLLERKDEDAAESIFFI
jgi:hypothetical protein